MSLLKIREPDGTVRVITIMKGDKGDGVPDGGSKGQFLKKTEGGTEWADMVSNSLVMENDNASWDVSCTITQRGLYEVAAYIATYETLPVRALLSVSNLVGVFDQYIYSGAGDIDMWLHYENGSITVRGNSEGPSYLSEVRLLIPYD